LIDQADPALLAALSSRLQAMKECAGASCLRTEEAPLPDALAAFLETPETSAGRASPVSAVPGNRA
jgi:hypothetical protein